MRTIIGHFGAAIVMVAVVAFPNSALANPLSWEGTSNASVDDSGYVEAVFEVRDVVRTKQPGSTASSSSSNLGSQPIALSPLRRWQAFIGTLPECVGDLGASEECRIPPADPARPDVVVPPLAAVTALAREVVLSLQLPDAGPRIGPDPHANEWDAAMVGFPLWLWTDGPRALTTTRDAYGVAFTLEAHHVATQFAMGDGHTLTCATTQAYPATTTPGTPSPVCGHVYEVASLPRGTYTVTATTVWDVRWSALGYSGTLPARMTASRDLRVGELQAVVVR